jgi:hypothetical protein
MAGKQVLANTLLRRRSAHYALALVLSAGLALPASGAKKTRVPAISAAEPEQLRKDELI